MKFSVILGSFIILAAFPLYSDQYFRSNILGMKLDLIGEENKDSGYVLVVSENDGRQIETLLESGVKIFECRKESRDGKSYEITEYIDRIETVVRENGVIVSEEVNRVDQDSEVINYVYANGKLLEKHFLIGGIGIYSEAYKYGADGRILEVVRINEESQIDEKIYFTFNEGHLSRYMYKSGGKGRYIKFDKNGILYSDSFDSGGSVETIEYKRLDNGGNLEVISYKDSGERAEILYDENGRIVSRLLKDKDENIIEEADWDYKNDLLRMFRLKKDLLLEVRLYEYNPQGRPEKETLKINGIIVRVTEYLDENSYNETLYTGGRPAVRVTYENNIRVRTEQLKD